MTETQNDYVATATAEKRLREVLDERFGGPDGIDGGEMSSRVAVILLELAEITYLPRKKSVSILLRVPETATPAKASKNRDGAATPPATPTTIGADNTGEQAAESATGSTPDAAPSRGAMFGQFVPTVTSNPDAHEDDYFVE